MRFCPTARNGNSTTGKIKCNILKRIKCSQFRPFHSYGLKGLQEGGGSDDHGSLFNHFFGGMFSGGGFGGPRGPAKCQEIVHNVSVTLEELYNGGRTIPFNLHRTVGESLMENLKFQIVLLTTLILFKQFAKAVMVLGAAMQSIVQDVVALEPWYSFRNSV
jgi:hypothetical protein